MREVGLGLMPKLMGQDWTWAFGLLDRRTMVANGTMGLLNCKVMTRDLWATDYGPARQTPPLFLTCYCVLGSLLWHGRPGMAESGAMGPLCDSSILL